LNHYGSTMKSDQHVSLRDSPLPVPLLLMDYILDVRPVLVCENLYFRLKLLESGTRVIAVAALFATYEASDQISAV
jgi:hypothetical protein